MPQQHRLSLVRVALDARRVLTAAALGALLGCGLALGGSRVSEPAQPTAHRSADPVRLMLRRHHCWTGEQPASMRGRLPTYAVIGPPDHPQLVDASVGFGIWLDHKPGRLYGFCR